MTTRCTGLTRGIDIVAEEANGDLCGIQCKCYADDHSIDLKALATFMTACTTYKMRNVILVYTGGSCHGKS